MHLILHVAVPAFVAVLVYRPMWTKAFLVMAATMLVDLDHLLADPLYDPNRCGIGFHPLHGWVAIAAYLLLLLPKKTRLPALGLVLHMALDGIDCVWMSWHAV